MDRKHDTVRIDITDLEPTHKRHDGRKSMDTMGTDDIQRIYDKLDEISKQMAGMTITSRSCDKAIHGNGTPGLLSRTTILEQAVINLTNAHKECPAREAMSGNARRQGWANIIALGSMAIALLAMLVAVK